MRVIRNLWSVEAAAGLERQDIARIMCWNMDMANEIAMQIHSSWKAKTLQTVYRLIRKGYLRYEEIDISELEDEVYDYKEFKGTRNSDRTKPAGNR